VKLRRRATSIIGQDGALPWADCQPACQSARAETASHSAPCRLSAKCVPSGYLRQTAVQAQVRRSRGAAEWRMPTGPSEAMRHCAPKSAYSASVAPLDVDFRESCQPSVAGSLSASFRPLIISQLWPLLSPHSKCPRRAKTRNNATCVAAQWAVLVHRLIGLLFEAASICQEFKRHRLFCAIRSSRRPWLRRRRRRECGPKQRMTIAPEA
jgi:hypothetical protein